MNKILQQIFLLNDDNNTDQPINTWQAVLIFVGIFAIVIFLMFIKKIFYHYYYKQRYYVIPRVGVKGLTYIGMVVAVSVSSILVLSIVSSGTISNLFRVFPSSRVAIEAVLIKISGLIFGPIIGLCSGIAIDILTVALSAGVFHYGYLISAMTFGLLSGLIKSLLVFSKGSDFKFTLCTTLSIVVEFVIFALLILEFPSFKTGLHLSFSKINFNLTQAQVLMGMGSFFALFVLVIWILYFLRFINAFMKKIFKYLAPVILMVLVSELINNIFLLPVFDVNINGNTWSFWFGARLGSFPVVCIANIIIVFAVYRIVAPLIKYDYTKELTEPLDTPFLIV